MSGLKLGVALGSGAARAWAHIGVLRALEARGLKPDIVCGSSVGSLVGAACASGQLDVLEDWVTNLRRADVIRLLDANFRGGGFIHGSRVMEALAEALEDRDIEKLPVVFGAVTTDLATGREIWLRKGSMLKAVRASSGLPGMIVPALHEGRWVIDGGVVNPVPVSLCHALGADLVIGVNLNADMLSRQNAPVTATEVPETALEQPAETELLDRVAERLGSLLPNLKNRDRVASPSLFEVLAATLAIMQERITRSRMAGDPPEVLLTPHLGHFQLLDFHNAAAAIEEGRQTVERMAPELDYLAAML